MKKISAVLLSILMVLICMTPMVSATYDKDAVVAGNYGDLTDDEVIGIVLDWLDGKIQAVSADFGSFEAEVFGQQVTVDLPQMSIDDIIGYKDKVAELGGDFAALDMSSLKTRAESGSNTAFAENVIQFMADNAETFGKVFRWDDEVFDYGKVGEYIMSEDCTDENIKTFYQDYLIGNNIQEKFVAEIAREMNYEVQQGETFDEVINNGIKAWALNTFGELLNAEGKAAVADYDLRTTDVYTLIKDFFYQLQLSNKAKLDDFLSSFLETLQGAIAAFAAIKDTVNLTPPTATISDYGTFVAGPYTPTNVDPNSYMPTIYASSEEYKTMIENAIGNLDLEPIEINGEEKAIQINVTADPVPAGLKNGNPTALVDGFKMKLEQGEETLLDLAIDFSSIENMVNAEIANQIPAMQQQVDAVVNAAVETANQMPVIGGSITGSVTINSITVALSYAGYETEDAFAMEVTATPTLDITYGGNVWNYASMAGITKEKIEADYIQPKIDEYVTNPIATVAVSNLNGSTESFDDLLALLDFIDTDAAYDPDILDFFKDGRYETYKGVVGQANRVFCDAVKSILTETAYADLGLTEGGNQNLYSNMQKLCSKVNSMLSTVKDFIDRDEFIELANTANISDSFASSHGFNAGMVYDMDFSSVENMLVCGIRMGCDMMVEDESGVLYDIHELVEDDATLDAMFAHVGNYFLKKAVDKLNADETTDFTYTYTDITGTDKAAVYNKLADILYEAAAWAVPKINNAVNGLIADLNNDFDLQIGNVNFRLNAEKGANWSATLGNLIDRFLGLTDGLIIYPSKPAASDSTLVKASKIANAVLPMESMFSGTTNLVTIDGYVDNALNGNFGGLLSLFETKQDAIAGGVSVTKALINASDYIVDAFFPDTVQSELYAEGIDVQETFTGAESDQGIAARNMVSINNRKADLIPVGCRLLKESDILKTLACTHETITTTPATAGTCKTPAMSEGKVCADCGLVVEAAVEGELNPAVHEGETQIRDEKAATCHTPGYTGDTWCLGCGNKISSGAATALDPANHEGPIVTKNKVAATTSAEGYSGDKVCEACGEVTEAGHATPKKEESQNFFQKIISSIRSIIAKITGFFKKLFK